MNTEMKRLEDRITGEKRPTGFKKVPTAFEFADPSFEGYNVYTVLLVNGQEYKGVASPIIDDNNKAIYKVIEAHSEDVDGIMKEQPVDFALFSSSIPNQVGEMVKYSDSLTCFGYLAKVPEEQFDDKSLHYFRTDGLSLLNQSRIASSEHLYEKLKQLMH